MKIQDQDQILSIARLENRYIELPVVEETKMSSPDDKEAEKFSQESQDTCFKLSGSQPDSDGSPFELKTDEESQPQTHNITSSSDEGKFTVPLSRTSLHTSNVSTDDKSFFTASQDTISLTGSDDTYSKISNLSLLKDSLEFDPTETSNLTPTSDDVKPIIHSQELFISTSSGNQGSKRLSQIDIAAFSSSTPRLRDSSSSDSGSPAPKRVKLDPDSSVEIIPKKAEIQDPIAVPTDSSPSKLSQGTAQLESDGSNSLMEPPPPTGESDFTLHFTQSGSQVKELTDVEGPKKENLPSSNGAINSTDELSDSVCQKIGTSWASHNYDDFSYDSHKNLSSTLSKNVKLENESKTVTKMFTRSSGPFRAVIKEIFCIETNKLVGRELVEFAYTSEEEAKENQLSCSSLSSGALGDVSSGSSSLCSVPGPFNLKGRHPILPLSTDSSGDRYSGQGKSDRRRRLPLVNGNKMLLGNIKRSPLVRFESVAVKCCSCKFEFPLPQFLSPSSLNGTSNGKTENISTNSSSRLKTPDISSPIISSSSRDNSEGSNSQSGDARSSTLAVSHQEVMSSCQKHNDFLNQSIVFGFWRNHYYPCRILNSLDDKYTVAFLDTGDEKLLSKNKLLPLSLLCPGARIKVLPENVVGELDSIVSSNVVAPFVVKVQNECKNYPIESIVIGEQQRKELLKLNNPTPATNLSSIDLDNCRSTKRNRTPRQSIVTSCMSTPKTGKSSRKLFKSMECKASTSEPRNGRKSAAHTKAAEFKSWSSDSDFDFKHYNLDLTGDGIREVHLEKFDDPLENFNMLKQKNVTPLNDDQEVIDQFGPIPMKGSNLFAGFVFVLSYTDDVVCKSHASSSSGTETDASRSDDFPESSYPFSRSRLAAQIRVGGGVVYSNITDVPFNDLPKCILISNKPSLTCTYIYALAEGIRAYTQDDIISCCINNKPFSEIVESKNYLPNGWSYSARSYKYRDVAKRKVDDKTDDSGRPKILKSKWVLVLFDKDTKENCVNFWTAILEIAGAQVKRGYAEVGTSDSPVYAIADESCPARILEKKDVKCVSVVWLIQSLINNSIVKPDSHSHFKYNFTSRPNDDLV